MSSTSKLVLAFVTLILGVVFAAQVATIGQGVTTTTAVTNETIDISDARISDSNINESVQFTLAHANTGWKTEPSECEITSPTLYINTSTVGTENTDYNITVDGIVTFKNTTSMINSGTNNTLISYSYCPDDYMNLSWGRTGINLVPGFFALALLLISVGLFYSIARENGIIG